MTVFMTLLSKIIPLYFSVILGFLSIHFLKCNKESIAKILLYVFAPLLVLKATMSVKLDSSIVFLPIFFFIVSSLMAFISLFIFKKIWNDNTANLLAFSTATGNTGNIGIPLAILFLKPAMVDVFIFTVLASILYQNSVGFYITAKGNFSAIDSIKRVLKLPALYAFIFGISFNLLGIDIPEMFNDYMTYLKGAYAILGMMFLGMCLENIKAEAFDKKFISYSLGMKFLLWPAIILLFIFLDKSIFHLLNKDLYLVMFLFSIVPLAGNTVTIATLLNVKPEKISLAVFISTLLSLFYIPLVVFLYIG
jgi:malate permease and related proteins